MARFEARGTETDAELIGRAANSPECFAAVFDRHYQHIYVYAARRLGPDLAEDLASETFLIAFDRRAGYDPAHADARPWLYGIASNLIARHGRAESRRYKALARAAENGPVAAHDDLVAGRVDASAVRGALARALSGLPRPVRDVLLLVGWAGLSPQEAAEALDIPAGTARSRLHRGRREMRRALGMDSEVDE
ncbi:RNA polymerase sigma factor [Phytohabitans sp. ZYX-F-186]|uniref:RNA polymerase sigma factor n=1 Tax=Phytohabitans maris TaxID=3071409 RepID=A0ABU0ZDL8_9ACTN|nr:RNA polymerase sigma factor [Phytohabitans sp. ZYX-F-186]MDQ7905156.1 RNA polymerase sigma factor [Phytohabitans sp. ZYX-F-186]